MLKKIDKTRVEAEKVQKIKEQNFLRHEERMKAIHETLKEQEQRKAEVRLKRERQQLSVMASKLKAKEDVQLRGIETRNQKKQSAENIMNEKVSWYQMNRVQASIVHEQDCLSREKRRNVMQSKEIAAKERYDRKLKEEE